MEAAGFRRLFRILSLRTKLGKLSPACWTSGGRFAKRRPLEGFPVPSAGRIAQLVEQLTLNQRVPGSSPGAPTKTFKHLQQYASERTFRFDVRFEKFVRYSYTCLTNGGMAARRHIGWLIPWRREELSHAEALAAEDAFTWNRSTSQAHFYSYPYTSLSFLIADSASSRRPPR
jgi:hypothetical protein